MLWVHTVSVHCISACLRKKTEKLMECKTTRRKKEAREEEGGRKRGEVRGESLSEEDDKEEDEDREMKGRGFYCTERGKKEEIEQEKEEGLTQDGKAD